MKKNSNRIPISSVPGLVKEAFLEFIKKDSLFHGAALAYYTLFAIIPLFYISVSIIGRIIGKDVMLVAISDFLRNHIGVQDLSGLDQLSSQLYFNNKNWFFEIISIITLLLISSAVIVSLKRSINEFFDIHVAYSSKSKGFYKNLIFRLISMVFVASFSLFIIIIYFAQAILMSLSNSVFDSNSIYGTLIAGVLQHGFALFSNIVIFTMVFKYVHDGFIKWKLAIAGAVLTSVLLYFGQLLIKYYLFNYFYLSSLGITGTLFVIMAWVYYSSQIIFFGAKFMTVYARRINKPIRFKE